MYDPYARYRQRAAKRMSNLLVMIFAMAGIFGIGYWLGGISAQQHTYILQREKHALNEEQIRLQNEITQIRAEAQTAKVRLEQLKTNYEELLSAGPMQELVSLVRVQIDKGVDPARLQSVILSARPPQNCSDPENKRFIVKTPVYQGPDSNASIGQGMVVVSATGESAKNAQGQNEAWFDPGQPVEITFHVKNKNPVTKKGLLPLYYSAISDDKEYRFSAEAGNKSFIKITYDHCDYP